MDIMDRAYVAGFFDADGCVSIGRAVRPSGSPWYQLVVIFSQKNEGFLGDLREQLGAGFISGRGHDLILASVVGADLLRQLIPFLCIKRVEAELAVRFRDDPDTVWQGPRRTPAHVTEKRDEYKEALSGLKAKRQVILPDPVPIGPLADIECAYLAGFIDGDGCLSITKHNRKDTPVPVYDLWLVMVQGEGKSFFEYWQERTGAGAVFRGRKAGTRVKFGDRRVNCTRDQYHWRLASKAAEGLLRQVVEFLRLKREQAELALQFRFTFAPQGGRGGKVPAEVIEERERCKLLLSGLNR